MAVKSTAFLEPNKVKPYLVGVYQKAHSLNRHCPPGLDPILVLSGYLQTEWGIPNEICQSEAQGFLLESAKFKSPDFKDRDTRINELVFCDMKARFNSSAVTPKWLSDRLDEHPAKRVEIQNLLGFNKGDFSSYLSGKKAIPKSRAILLFLFFEYA